MRARRREAPGLCLGGILRYLYWMLIGLGLFAIVIGVAQTIATLNGGNGVWLHLEAGGPGSAMGGAILAALGRYLLQETRSEKGETGDRR